MRSAPCRASALLVSATLFLSAACNSTSGGSTGNGGSGGPTGNGGAGATGGGSGTTGSGGATGSGGSTGADGGTTTGASVLQHHNDAARDGVYVDARLTRAAAMTMHVDTTFANATVMGPVYAQPLYLAGTGGGSDMVIVATERNHVTAFNAATGGTPIWDRTLATPVSSGLPCGNIAGGGNTLGITGTPVIDGATRTIYLDAMTADTTVTAKHMIHALDLSTGMDRAGWPVDVNATASSGGTAFNSVVQNQRAALALVGGKVFVPYGGHVGDCQGYHGWVVGVTTSGTPAVSAWATRGFAGGIWGASGIASDGTSIYVATGNTKASATSGAFGSSPANWSDGETVFRFPTTLVPPAITASTEFYFPADWATMDQNDQDIGGTGPVLINVPGANPSSLVMAIGKDGKAYLLSRGSLGGMDAAPLAGLTVSQGAIIQASVAYTTPTASYVVFRNGGSTSGCPGTQTGGLTAIKIAAASPPTLSVAWCGGPALGTSPAVSMTDAQGTNTLVWAVGSDNKLHAVDGDTGASVFAGGSDTLPNVQQIQTPIVANGRIWVVSSSRLYALTP